MKKLGLWLATICLMLCSAFAAIGCNIGGKKESAAVQEYVELSDSTLSLEVYSEYTLSAITNVSADIVWKTSDATIATVENGVVSALSVGSATITASAGKASASCLLTVTHLSGFPELTLSETTLQLVEGGDSITVDATVTYKGEAVDYELTWETANPSIATVVDGTITPVAIGETTVTVTAECLGEIITKEIRVIVSVDEQIVISKGAIALTLAKINADDLVEDTFIAQAYLKGEANNAPTLSYESSDTSVAIVEVNGKEATVKAVGLGSCVIKVFYQSENGKIQSYVDVTVARAEVVVDGVAEMTYMSTGTKLDLSLFDMAGEFQGVYYAGECVSSADGTLTKDFATANNHGFAIDVELRTDIAVYYTQIAISIEYATTGITTGESAKEQVAYEGDVTALGFEEGATVIQYKHLAGEAWENRLLPKDSSKIRSFDHWIVEFSLSADATASAAGSTGILITAWVGQTHLVLVSANQMQLIIYDPSGTDDYQGSDSEHKADPCISIYDENGKIPSHLAANQKYYFEMHIEHAGKGDSFAFGFNDALDVYIANSYFCTDAYYDANIAPTRDNTPPDVYVPAPEHPVVQGDTREVMPTYDGDVTTLGFAEDTVVYELENSIPDDVWNDAWNKRAIIYTNQQQDYVSLEFVMGVDVSMGNIFSVWGVAGIPYIGQVSCNGMTGSWAVITDMDGNIVDGIEKGKHYVLSIACAELSEIQIGSIVSGYIYFANITFGNGSLIPDAPLPPSVWQGDDRREMPTYDGDVTALGFPADTETVYVIEGNASDAWNNRIVMGVESGKDFVKFDIAFSTAVGHLTMWPANDSGTHGAYSVTPTGSSTSDGDENRRIFVVDKNGNSVTSFEAGVVYTVYFYLIDETNVQMSTFVTANVYVANIASFNEEDIQPEQPTDAVITQGEGRKPMPIYDGDVTALGFAEGTVVYQIAGPQSNDTDVKLVAQIDVKGAAYAKMDIVFSKATSSFSLWITAATTHLGHYTVTPTGYNPDSLADPSREVFVTDANGDKVTSFEANKVYTLYIGLDGREATVQVSTWAALMMYVANVACIAESDAPVDPVPPVDGKEISILFIGNSFSDDTEAYMVDILLALGYTNINIGNLYIGGCSIDTHYSNIISNASAYEFRMRSHNGKKYTEYETVSVGGTKQSISFAIAYKNWDVISVQQASGESGKAETYKNLDALVAEVKKQATNSDVEIVFNMTWAYQGDSTHAQFPDYNSDQMTMYNAIVNAVQSQVKYTVVPNGTAIQNARTSLLGDTLTRDGYHLDLKIGRFIAGLTFVAKVTGEDISKIDFVPGGVNELQYAIAIESVQNALAAPFAVTQSEIEEVVVENPDVVAGGSNTTAVTIYKGDETALGFAEGTIVYEYVGVDMSADKASIKVDSTQYDYVDVQLVITKGSGYFFLYGLKDGNWYNGGVSYVIDPSWLRLGDGKNSASDRTIEVYDAAGNKVTTLMKQNVVYTLRVYIKLGELDEIRIAQTGSTIYFANVKQGLESDLSDPTPDTPVVPEGPVITQGDNRTNMPLYKGDVTTLGFAAGTTVYTLENTTPANGYDDGWVKRAIISAPGTQKYVTFEFVAMQDITKGVFHVWGPKGVPSMVAVWCVNSSMEVGFITDMNGSAVGSVVAGTHYLLHVVCEGMDEIQVGLISGDNIVYFANVAYANGEKVEVDTTPTYSADGGHNNAAANTYTGDVTALGFAEGATVYEQVVSDGWNDRVGIAVDSNYDYVDIQFAITESTTLCIWLNDAPLSMLTGNYTIDSAGQVMALNGAAARTMQVLDAEGNVVTAIEANTVYTLRIYVDGLVKVQLSTYSGTRTIYYGDVSFGNDK